MPQIRGFAVQEGIVQTCQSVVDAYGLKAISGSDGDIQVLEDIPEMAKSYKVGDSIQFTAKFNAIFDPEKKTDTEEAGDATIIDVEAETV